MPYIIDTITADTINVIKEIILRGEPIGSGGSLIDQEIQIETFGLDLTFSEQTDYTQPLVKEVTTNFKGISHQTQSTATDGEFGELKVVTRTLFGLVDAIYITELFGELFPPFIGEEIEGETPEPDLSSLISKMISISLDGGVAFNLTPGSKFEIFYRYFNPEGSFGGEIAHEVKFTVQENFFTFSFSPNVSDLPLIERFNIDTEGVVNILNPIIILNNLPDEDGSVEGQLYEDESGFIKVKRNI
jgi:hypothetical protein